MNIFMTSASPMVSARALDDKRVIKMALESAQMLSTCLRENALRDDMIPDLFYRSTHKNHPCTRWLDRRLGNFMWLRDHGLYLCDEYSFRYDREHASRQVIDKSIDYVGKATTIDLSSIRPEYGGFNSSGYDTGNVFHDYKLCMIDKWRDDKDPKTPSRTCRWTRRGPPGWLDKDFASA